MVWWWPAAPRGPDASARSPAGVVGSQFPAHAREASQFRYQFGFLNVELLGIAVVGAEVAQLMRNGVQHLRHGLRPNLFAGAGGGRGRTQT